MKLSCLCLQLSIITVMSELSLGDESEGQPNGGNGYTTFIAIALVLAFFVLLDVVIVVCIYYYLIKKRKEQDDIIAEARNKKSASHLLAISGIDPKQLERERKRKKRRIKDKQNLKLDAVK